MGRPGGLPSTQTEKNSKMLNTIVAYFDRTGVSTVNAITSAFKRQSEALGRAIEKLDSSIERNREEVARAEAEFQAFKRDKEAMNAALEMSKENARRLRDRINAFVA